jgi:hypothetical protein
VILSVDNRKSHKHVVNALGMGCSPEVDGIGVRWLYSTVLEDAIESWVSFKIDKEGVRIGQSPSTSRAGQTRCKKELCWPDVEESCWIEHR